MMEVENWKKGIEERGGIKEMIIRMNGGNVFEGDVFLVCLEEKM